ncbi:OmpA family protein [Pusillimonas sp. NJUB218]|uniref:OmpA/MotB family protein n=1 Tax=Pusillimonas sp. NJUB218 TaxID=2023230 RepID=UPI0018F72C61|nr:OmpA family protein [Pusillimonas sp. NJUB218]
MPPRSTSNLTLEEIAKLRRREFQRQQAAGSYGVANGPPTAEPGSYMSTGASPYGPRAGLSPNLRAPATAGAMAAAQAAQTAPAVANPQRFDKWYFEPQSEEETDSWLITYLDTITLLLVFMLVMLMLAGKGEGVNVREGIMPGNLGIFARERSTPAPDIAASTAGKAPVTQAGGSSPLPLQPSADDGTRPDPLQGLNLGNLGSDIDVVINEKSVSFRINSEILFSSGQAELSRDGLAVLQRLIKVLKESPHKVTIEGHTDAIPIRSARFPSNWELSSARAGSVVRYFEANGIVSTRLRAIGYADTKPLATNDTPENRALNRRVELLMETVEE